MNFSNLDSMSPLELLILQAMCYNKKYFENTTMYFPIDVPITKYMLNYSIYRIREKENYFSEYIDNGGIISNYLGTDDVGFETDISKMPSNYEEYPYIIKGVPREVYEKPLMRTAYDFNTPAECIELSRFVSYGRFELYSDAKRYFDTILNVDYRTIDVDTMYNSFINNRGAMCVAYLKRDEVEAYVDWVKRNHIILKGKGCVVPGTIYISGMTSYIRSMMEFEIISADVRENLLFNDQFGKYGHTYDEEQNNPVIYTRNSYKISFDLSLTKKWWSDNNNEFLGMLSYMLICPTFIPNVVTLGNTEPDPRIMPDDLWQ